MTVQEYADIAIGLGLVGWIVYRQLTWRIVSISRMWRLPLILGAIGAVMLAQMNGGHPVSSVDLVVLIVELVISLGIGLVMGRIAVFRAQTETVLESRTGWLGLALWIVLVMVRVGIEIVATGLGSTLASAMGVILVMVAANRIARVFVFAGRLQNRSALTA